MSQSFEKSQKFNSMNAGVIAAAMAVVLCFVTAIFLSR